MDISIVGTGVVGKATGIGFHKHGNEVVFYDTDDRKLSNLSEEGFKVARDTEEAVSNSNISFVCIQTPTVNGRMNFEYVKRAVINVANALRLKNEYHVVVIRSTVLPSTTRTKVIPLLEQYSQLGVGEHFGVCSNPEFLREASALQDFLNPSRIVIGELDKQSGDLLEKLYIPFKTPLFRTDLDTAEMIKYVANLYLTTKISFYNEVYTFCTRLGLDPHFISEVVSLDKRVGKYGIYGGRPFEGSCLPKDLEAFITFLGEKRINPKLLDAVLYINNEMAKRGKINAK